MGDTSFKPDEFIETCHALEDFYKSDCIVQSNGTKLLGIPPKRPPLAKHILYSGLNFKQIELIKNAYKGFFPKSLLRFYGSYNGGSFFCNDEYAQFEIFGFHFKPYTGDLDNLEPGNISVMDIGRHRRIPKHWLKCAWYYTPDQIDPWEIFIDTKSEMVYSYLHLKYKKNNEWDSLDKCFCEIFNSYTDIQKHN